MKTRVNKKVWIILAYIILFTILGVFKLNTFQASYEFGWEEHIIFNTLDGRFYFQEDQNIQSLASHFHIIHIAIITPLYYIFNHSATFFFVQTTMMTLTALLLFQFSKKYLGEKGANIIFYMFLLFPLVVNTMLEDFHGIIYAPPLIVLLFWAFDTKKNWLIYLSAILLVLVQEDMALIVIMMGLYFWLIRKNNIGFKILLIGLISFILIPNIIQPSLVDNYVLQEGGSFLHYSYKFGYLGEDIGSIIKTMITRPGFALTYTPLSLKFIFLKSLLLPLLLIPLLSPAIIIASPIILEILLHSSAGNTCPNSYHVISIIPIIFISLVLGLHWLEKKIGTDFVNNLLKILLVMVIILLLFGEVGHWFSKDYFLDNNFFGGDACMKNEFKIANENRWYSVSKDVEIMNAVKSIPTDSRVLVPFHIYSNFVRAREDRTFFLSQNCFNYDYIILDKEDLYFPEGEEIQFMKNKLTNKGYEIIFEKEEFIILKKDFDKEVCI